MKKLALCPFIGMIRDPETVVGYPSGRNRCYADSSKPITPSEEYQETYCLRKNFVACEIIIKKQQGGQ